MRGLHLVGVAFEFAEKGEEVRRGAAVVGGRRGRLLLLRRDGLRLVVAWLFLDKRKVGLAGPRDLGFSLSEGRIAGVVLVGLADLGMFLDFDGLRDDSLLLQTTLSLRKRVNIQGSSTGLLQQHYGRRLVGIRDRN